jgi:hypothetical protein
LFQIEREMMGIVGHPAYKPGFCKDHIRPALVGIVEQQSFRRECLTIYSHCLEEIGFIRMCFDIRIKSRLAVCIDPDSDRGIIVIGALCWRRCDRDYDLLGYRGACNDLRHFNNLGSRWLAATCSEDQ